MLVHLLRGLHGLRLRFLDHRIDDVSLAALVDLLLQKAVDLLRLRSSVTCLVTIGLRPGGSSSITRDVQVAVDGQRQRARNRRRRHHQHIRMRCPSPSASAAAPRRSDAARRRSPAPAVGTRRPSSSSACVPTTTCAKPAASSFLSCAFSRAVERSGQQHRHVAQLLEQLLEIEDSAGWPGFRWAPAPPPGSRSRSR